MKATVRDSETQRGEASHPDCDVVVYEAPGGEVRVDVRLDRETVWPTRLHEPPRVRRPKVGAPRFPRR